MASKTRVRYRRDLTGAGNEGYQGVCMECNHRTQWFKGEDTAQEHIDKHVESKHDGKKTSKKSDDDKADETPDEPLREQGADDIPPGGQNTGPRGDDG
jgi:hypothetical protein